MPFAASGLCFLGCPATPVSSWVCHYLQVLGCRWDEMCSHFGDDFCPDTLFFLWDPREPVFSPMSYAQALRRVRVLLGMCFPTGSAMSYTLHSAKATMLSWCAEALLPKHVAQVQGHHAVDTQRKYARDDTFLALSAQRTVMYRLLEGWCPAVPIARGAQCPMSNEPLQLCAVLSESVCHPRFQYHNQNHAKHELLQHLQVPEAISLFLQYQMAARGRLLRHRNHLSWGVKRNRGRPKEALGVPRRTLHLRPLWMRRLPLGCRMRLCGFVPAKASFMRQCGLSTRLQGFGLPVALSC